MHRLLTFDQSLLAGRPVLARALAGLMTGSLTLAHAKDHNRGTCRPKCSDVPGRTDHRHGDLAPDLPKKCHQNDPCDDNPPYNDASVTEAAPSVTNNFGSLVSSAVERNATVGRAGMAGNLVWNLTLESTRPSIPASEELMLRHRPLESTYASPASKPGALRQVFRKPDLVSYHKLQGRWTQNSDALKLQLPSAPAGPAGGCCNRGSSFRT